MLPGEGGWETIGVGIGFDPSLRQVFLTTRSVVIGRGLRA